MKMTKMTALLLAAAMALTACGSTKDDAADDTQNTGDVMVMPMNSSGIYCA